MDWHTFTLWPNDPSLGVCATCGRTAGAGRHSAATSASTSLGTYLPYEEAIWAWMLAHGGIRSIYGGKDSYSTLAAKEHLESCSIDYSQSSTPEFTTVYEFNGTDADSIPVRVSAARLYCVCGDLRARIWVMDGDLTLGEIIFQVVSAGAPS